MNDERSEQIKREFREYRKRKRQHYFMVKGAIAKQARERNSAAGDPAPALKPELDVARSSGVALPPLPKASEARPSTTGSPAELPKGEGTI